MITYIIVFDQAVRIGLDVFEAVGPFDTVSDAVAWLGPDWAGPVGTIRATLKP